LFHAQQAVEKCLKAFLTHHDHRFRKTHDLVELGRECVALDPSLEQVLRQAAPLTEHAWRYRYPGDDEEPAAKDVEQALTLARDVWNMIAARLPLPPT
jgi:HEPN domain-containing protein